MRLVIDCYKLIKGTGKSIGIYNLTKSLVENLAVSEEVKSGKNEIVVLGNEENRQDFEREGVIFRNVGGKPHSKGYLLFWELILSAKWARKEKADRILFPRGYRPLVCKVPDAVIIHDLIPFYYDKHFPGVFNRMENMYIMNRLKASIRHADRIITISEYSKKEIEAICPKSSDRIRIIYNGYNNVTCGEEYRTSKPYIYANTTVLPHKNAGGILKAYEEYRRISSDPLELVIVGIENAEAYDISEETAKHVTCYKYIKNFKDVCSIVKGAEAFLFLSLMEGFGFPPLEAMQLGVPVVCSDRSSLPEVTADAALLVDPEKPNEVALALERIVKDKALRKELVQKGFENIGRFSWKSRVPLYWNALEGEK